MEQVYKAQVDSVFNSEIRKKESVISARLQRIQELESISDKLKAAIAREIDSECLSQCEEYKRQLAGNQAEIASLKSDPEFVKVKGQLEEIEKERKKQLAQSKKVAAGLDGLLERIKLAHEIAGFWISTFITLLFMAIELTPIFFKLMLIKSPYDFLEENVKEIIKAENAIEIIHGYYQDKEGVHKDLVRFHLARKVIDDKVKLMEAQAEMTDEAIATWKENERQKIKTNIASYISNQSSTEKPV